MKNTKFFIRIINEKHKNFHQNYQWKTQSFSSELSMNVFNKYRLFLTVPYSRLFPSVINIQLYERPTHQHSPRRPHACYFLRWHSKSLKFSNPKHRQTEGTASALKLFSRLWATSFARMSRVLVCRFIICVAQGFRTQALINKLHMCPENTFSAVLKGKKRSGTLQLILQLLFKKGESRITAK
jgi:hypothetical protein